MPSLALECLFWKKAVAVSSSPSHCTAVRSREAILKEALFKGAPSLKGRSESMDSIYRALTLDSALRLRRSSCVERR